MPISNINESGSFRDELLNKNLVITKDGNDDWKNYNNQLKDGDKVGQPIDYFSNEGDIKNSYSFSNESLNDVISIGNFIINSPTEGSLSNNKFYYLSNDNKKEYLDINGKLNVGGPSTEPYNIVSSFLNGQGGVGFGSKGLVTNNDIRNTLSGRALAAAGLINDSEIGKIGGQQLAIQLGNNALFHLQKETIGKINTDVWTLFDGKSDKFIKPNYDITVPDGAFGKTIDFLADLGGFSLPKSQMDVDLYSFDKKFKFTKLGNIERANEMLKNTGNGQVMALMVNLNASILSASNSNSKLSYRQGYAPPFKKGIGGKKEVEEPNMYAYGDSYNDLNGLIEPETFDKGPLDDWKSTERSGFDMDYHNDGKFATDEDNNTVSDFTWYGSEYNNDMPDNALSLQDKVIGLSPDDNPETLFMKVAHRRSLLYKTKELFKNNKIATLTSGHGVKDAKNSQIQNIPSFRDKTVGFMSKGSGVLSQAYLDDYSSSVTDPKDIFCRTWTPNDQYNEVRDQLKNDAIYKFIGNNGSGKIGYIRNSDLISESVLDNTGHVKVPLYDYEKADTTKVKRYMFSIENLAWLDNPEYLMSCEKGPHGGRIMWFPPYDMSFSESVSVNWDKNQFIGRGESLYTYNNTERTGSLSFKLIMDYPSDYDCLKNSGSITNEIFASIASGCHYEDGILQYLTCNEIEVIKEAVSEKKPDDENESKYKKPNLAGKDRFYIFFPNDVDKSYYTKWLGYESGLFDYENNDIITNPFKVEYIEDKTETINNESFTYKTWKDKYKILYRFAKEDSEVAIKLKNDDEYEYYKMNNDKPFYLSYDKIDVEYGHKTYVNKVDYGLNGNRADNVEHNIQLPSGDNANGFKCKKPNCKYTGWTDPQFLDDLAEFLKINYTVVLNVYGYASISGNYAYNLKLSERRETATKAFLEKKLKELGVDNIKNRIITAPGVKGETNEWSKDYNYLPQICTKTSDKTWYLDCKINRRVNIVLEDKDYLYKKQDLPKSTTLPPKITQTPTKVITPEIIKRTYTECDHFKKLERNDKFTYDKLKEKLQYFSPAFHSITPEGFNSRLTFLHQCTRQGNTNNKRRPDNLAFGRPPVSILRIGDFFYTKIVIESMSIDYEPLVWDLNPEGVGVQPMIANVTLNFAFIGGSSLNGPIKKLQNALSFNYYANTGIFDGRADTGNKTEEPKPKAETLEPQVKPIPVDNYILDEEAIKKMAEDESSILDLTLTAEYDKKINRSKATDDGFKFTIKPYKPLNYDYTFKIYLIGTDINGKEVREDLNVKSNEFPAGELEIESTCEKVKPEKAYDTITLKDRQLEEYKWASVLDNLTKEFKDRGDNLFFYILGLSVDESDDKPLWTEDGGKISYLVYEKTDDKSIAHVICNFKKSVENDNNGIAYKIKDAKEYYARKDIPYGRFSTIKDAPTMIYGKTTEFNFEIEFFRNNKSIKKVTKPYLWESEYKPIKSDICKAKYREKVTTGNESRWFQTIIQIDKVDITDDYTGLIYDEPSELLDNLESPQTDPYIEYTDTRVYKITKSKLESFISKLKDKLYQPNIDKIDKIIEPIVDTTGFLITTHQLTGKNEIETLYDEAKQINNDYCDNYNLYLAYNKFAPKERYESSFYLEGDEINEEDRVIYAGFNSGLDTTKTQLMITEGIITPTK